MEKQIKRLAYLCAMLAKYAHRWAPANGSEPSNRMYAWVDEYTDIKDKHPEAFAEYCKRSGADPKHNAYDCLA